jgi:hypothetical protein
MYSKIRHLQLEMLLTRSYLEHSSCNLILFYRYNHTKTAVDLTNYVQYLICTSLGQKVMCVTELLPQPVRH